MGRRRRRKDISLQDFRLAFESPLAAGVMLVGGLAMLALYYVLKPSEVSNPSSIKDLGAVIYGPMLIVEYITAWLFTLVGACASLIHLLRPRS